MRNYATGKKKKKEREKASGYLDTLRKVEKRSDMIDPGVTF